jgi:hypothetical protein
MNFNCDWNEEVVAQFYATLYVDRENKIFHWTLQGKRFSVGYAQFASILGFPSTDLNKPKLHDDNVLDDDDMHYMYDSEYGEVELGTVFGLAPFYEMLNQLFRYTLAPKSGNSD